MTNFDNREKGFETKHALDEETKFRIEARATRLLGLWVVEKFGLSGEAADNYAREVASSNLEEAGFGDVFRKVLGDAASRTIALDEATLAAKMQECMNTAQAQLTNNAA